MGYGSRALQQLQLYYEGQFPYMDENAQTANSQITSVTSEVMPHSNAWKHLHSPTEKPSPEHTHSMSINHIHREQSHPDSCLLLSLTLTPKSSIETELIVVTLLEEVLC